MTKKLALLFLLVITLSWPCPLRAGNFDDALIEGFVLEKVARGKKVYAITADKATLANKRIGFFEIGISKVVLLENASFTLYEDGAIVKTEYFDHATYEISTKRLFDERGKVVFNEQLLFRMYRISNFFNLF